VTELLDLARRVAGWANGGEQVEAFVVHERETHVRAYGGEVESLTAAESQGIGIRVIDEGRQGFAYAGVLDDDVVKSTLAEARDNARFGSPDEYAGLAEPDGVAPPDLALYRDDLVDFSPDLKVELAIELERATLGADRRVSSVESADYVDSIYESAVATTTGIASASRDTACYLTSYALAQEGDETQTGFGFSLGRHPSDLDPTEAAADAAQRATRLLGAVKPRSERLTVVLDPFVTAQLLGILGGTLTGDSVLKGRSMFADRMGETVAASSVTLIDDATHPDAFTASTIDAEGLATRPTTLIDGGAVTAFLYDAYSGRRSGSASTASATRNGFKYTPSSGALALRLVPGRRSQSELVSEIDDGFLVQGVAGLHSGVNPVSGDFSTGAEGLRIRDGALAEPIREVTIASTIQRLLQDVIEVGGDQEWLPMNAAGVSLVVADVTMSGM
jgi:PmbA protein